MTFAFSVCFSTITSNRFFFLNLYFSQHFDLTQQTRARVRVFVRVFVCVCVCTLDITFFTLPV